jgi:uracil-DNA glycosylase family 4
VGNDAFIKNRTPRKLWRAGPGLHPKIIVCLGATAAQTLLGRTFRVTEHRGEFLKSELAPYLMATVHPSSILRAPDAKARHDAMKQFVADLKKIADVL